MAYLIGFIIGLIMGAGVIYLLLKKQLKDAETIAQRLYTSAEENKNKNIDDFLSRIKDSFSSISLEVLSKQNELGTKDLENKRSLIDKSLEAMKKDLDKLFEKVDVSEKDRIQKYTELSKHLVDANTQTTKLQETAQKLHDALANTKVRGTWGERMAEDVLRLIGFVENTNYYKQKTLENTSNKPDFTFLLPENQKLNMDVKFPLTNYLNFLQSSTDDDRHRYKTQFLRDVKARINEIKTREYINDSTLDYVLVFIPNEQVYTFVQENDHDILDYALSNRVILCSPMTLYAILIVIRKAVENFNLENRSKEIIVLLENISRQWEKFKESYALVGNRIDALSKAYGDMTATRTNQLDRQFDKIDTIKQQQFPALN